MPVVIMSAVKCPPEPLERQAARNRGVLIHVQIIIEINEFETHRLSEHGEGDGSKARANRCDSEVLGRKTFV
jgi:hypothetical protein